MANEQLQNVPTPELMYPKSSGLYLMTRIHELTANVADLINVLVQRDAKIAAMEARIAELEAPSNVTEIKAAD